MEALFSMASEVAEKYGLFAAMFICILVYVLIKNDQREKRYIDREEKYIAREEKYIGVIENLSEGFEGLDALRKDVSEIKQKLWKEG